MEILKKKSLDHTDPLIFVVKVLTGSSVALPQLWAPPPSRFSPPLTALLQREWFSIGGKGRDNAKGEIKGKGDQGPREGDRNRGTRE